VVKPVKQKIGVCTSQVSLSCSSVPQSSNTPFTFNLHPACLAHKKQKDIIRAFNAGKKLPTDDQIPIMAADFSGAVPFLYDGSKAS
jgi:hypothetical protein